MTRKLFGTDGVRGVAGELLSAELALALARAATRQTGAERPQVLIVRDTRESGEMLQAAVAAGVSAAGGDALLGGVLPTPAAPLLIGRYGFDLAAVLSASHNPYQDNGIKFFAGDGYKLSDEAERQIERELEQDDSSHAGARARRRRAIGRVRELRGAPEDYLRELHTRFSELDLTGLDVLLDCANGATYHVAPEIFRRLGANVTVIADAPDGRNINAGCGSTHVERAGRAGPRGRPRGGLRVRRRRRPGAGGGSRWSGRGRRRADGARRAAPARRRTAERQRRGRDGDDQLRLPRRDGACRRGGGDDARWAIGMCSRSCARAAGCSAASSPGTSSTWASTARATGSPARCSPWRRWRGGT